MGRAVDSVVSAFQRDNEDVDLRGGRGTSLEVPIQGRWGFDPLVGGLDSNILQLKIEDPACRTNTRCSQWGKFFCLKV